MLLHTWHFHVQQAPHHAADARRKVTQKRRRTTAYQRDRLQPRQVERLSGLQKKYSGTRQLRAVCKVLTLHLLIQCGWERVCLQRLQALGYKLCFPVAVRALGS